MIVLIVLLQNTLSEEIRIGQFVSLTLRDDLAMALTNQIWLAIKILVLVPVVIFWLLDRRKPLRYALLVSLGLLTFELLASVLFLVVSLRNDTARQAVGLLRDTVTVAAINILVFSLWYWITGAYPLQVPPPTRAERFFVSAICNFRAEICNMAARVIWIICFSRSRRRRRSVPPTHCP